MMFAFLFVAGLLFVISRSLSPIHIIPSSDYSSRSFRIVGDNFEKDGVPFRIVSGSVHYFRIPPSLWRDRLHKLRLMGLNTIETYLAWNFHQESPTTEPDFSSVWRDVAQFVRIAEEEGLLVTIRPGPYICSEWDFGGLPAWLLSFPEIRTRCSNEQYLEAVDAFFGAALKVLSPLQYNLGGGPIILAQIENEYGNHGNDQFYLHHLVDLFHKYGFDQTPLFMSNPISVLALEGGTLRGHLKTANFGWGSDFRSEFGTLRSFMPTGPLFCTEWWDGWFDYWGQKHHTAPVEQSAANLNALLSYTNKTLVSVNIYMAHGGTNFGFWNGGGGSGSVVTSYDYDAPLNESGDPTDKYFAYRNVISKFVPVPPGPLPVPSKKAKYGKVTLTHAAYFLSGSPSKNSSTIEKNRAS